MTGGWLTALLTWIYLGLVVLLLLVAILRKREPASALAWSLAIIFVPGLGPLLFLLVGINRAPRRLRRKIAHRADYAGRRSSDKRQDAEKPPYPTTGWGVLGRVMESLDEAPRRSGNSIQLFSEGIRLAEAVIPVLEEARHHLHVELYIFRDDDTGKRLVDLLLRKVRQGVQVRLIVDGLGSFKSWRLLRRLCRAGGQATVFQRLFSPVRFSPNLRNHRKIIICDGRVGFFGGMNVGEEYLGRHGRLGQEWYDLHVEIRGPAVWDLQSIFAEDWDFCTGETLEDDVFYPKISSAGRATAQIIAGGPDYEVNPIRQAYFTSFIRAKKHIYLTTPYFVPDRGLRDALATAAMSGREVHVVTQSFPPDRYLPYFCGLYYIEEMLEAGVRVYEYAPGMTHAKAVSVDGEWAMIGTANLDNRSMFLNFEQMAIFDRKAEAGLIEEELKKQVSSSRELSLDAFRRQSGMERLCIMTARLFAPLL